MKFLQNLKLIINDEKLDVERPSTPWKLTALERTAVQLCDVDGGRPADQTLQKQAKEVHEHRRKEAAHVIRLEVKVVLQRQRKENLEVSVFLQRGKVVPTSAAAHQGL